ncbi:MAG: serine/threonine-protein kinase [Myxococcota bacterium]
MDTPSRVERPTPRASTLRPLPTTGQRIADKYIVQGILGHGGLSVVFEVRHARTGRAFALKWLLPRFANDAEAEARLTREAEVACTIGHPAVVDIYDVETHDGHPFLLMERLVGETLAQRLARGALEPAVAVRLLVPALEALGEAHRLAVIHRDLKPENLFVCRGRSGEPERVKILDFGVSKRVQDDAAKLRLTTSQAVIGTPYYMSPEQIVDPARVDHRADIYAMGCVLFETLAGRPPFEGPNLPALVYAISSKVPPTLSSLVPGLPARLDDIVAACLQKSPSHRPGTMAELAGWLFDALEWPPMDWMDVRGDTLSMRRDDLEELPAEADVTPSGVTPSEVERSAIVEKGDRATVPEDPLAAEADTERRR